MCESNNIAETLPKTINGSSLYMCMKAMFEINCINVNAKLYEITDNI